MKIWFILNFFLFIIYLEHWLQIFPYFVLIIFLCFGLCIFSVLDLFFSCFGLCIFSFVELIFPYFVRDYHKINKDKRNENNKDKFNKLNKDKFNKLYSDKIKDNN